ncbi:MAG: carbamate kinase [Alphaproteobacteria bacterium]|nr:carbamate kinase [Alphaproteobacteria bacterium]
MRVVVALGGNALLRRGQAMTAENQRANVKIACEAMAEIVRKDHQLVIAHGNGPQVGLLALQGAAYKPDEAYPLDVLVGDTQGQIGYLIEQELGNILPFEQPFATILTQIEVDRNDPAFHNPTKPIGPVYEKEEAERLAAERGWTIAPDGDKYRRVVPSPLPKRIFELRVVEFLVDHGVIVICAGGGGIPTMYREDGSLAGVEAVIDKDRAGALLASGIKAEVYLMLTDADAVYQGWGTPEQKAIRHASPHALAEMEFAAGSMGPKVQSACEFAVATGGIAGIGQLSDALAIVEGRAGTLVSKDFKGIEYA